MTSARGTAHHQLHLQEFLGSAGIQVVFRQTSRGQWEEAIKHIKDQRITISNTAIDYHVEYEIGNGRKYDDLSSILQINGAIVAVWPLSVSTASGYRFLSRPGGLASHPYFLDQVPCTLRERVIKACYNACLKLASHNGQREFLSSCFEAGSMAISPWQIYAMQKGAACTIKHEALVDLSLPIQDIRGAFRKSFKPLISKSEKIWNASVVSEADLESKFKQFKSLHLSVSGRKTRSDKSWDLQKQAIIANESFLIIVSKAEGESETVVGGGLFMASRYEGRYAVGAYDRNLFNQPVSHIVQWRAIEELKKRGCSWYHIGRCDFPGDQDSPEAKTLSISQFKAGFANAFSCSYILAHKLSA